MVCPQVTDRAFADEPTMKQRIAFGGVSIAQTWHVQQKGTLCQW